jgi:hypothetical protein
MKKRSLHQIYLPAFFIVLVALSSCTKDKALMDDPGVNEKLTAIPIPTYLLEVNQTLIPSTLTIESNNISDIKISITDPSFSKISTNKLTKATLNQPESTSNANGIAQIEWTLGSPGIQEVEALVRKRDGTLVNGAPLTFTTNFQLTGYWKLNFYEDQTRAKLTQSDLINFQNGSAVKGQLNSTSSYPDGKTEDLTGGGPSSLGINHFRLQQIS